MNKHTIIITFCVMTMLQICSSQNLDQKVMQKKLNELRQRGVSFRAIADDGSVLFQPDDLSQKEKTLREKYKNLREAECMQREDEQEEA